MQHTFLLLLTTENILLLIWNLLSLHPIAPCYGVLQLHVLNIYSNKINSDEYTDIYRLKANEYSHSRVKTPPRPGLGSMLTPKVTMYFIIAQIIALSLYHHWMKCTRILL